MLWLWHVCPCPAAAGVVASAAELLDVRQVETSVRCLMVLGMLCPHSPAAQQQLASNAQALQQLLALLKQQEDMDAKLISRWDPRTGTRPLCPARNPRSQRTKPTNPNPFSSCACCVKHRDLIRILMQDEGLKGQVEAAVRQASSQEQEQQEQQQGAEPAQAAS